MQAVGEALQQDVRMVINQNVITRAWLTGLYIVFTTHRLANSHSWNRWDKVPAVTIGYAIIKWLIIASFMVQNSGLMGWG